MKRLLVLTLMLCALPVAASAQSPADLVSPPETMALWNACQTHRTKDRTPGAGRYEAGWENCVSIDKDIEAMRVRRQDAVDQGLRAKVQSFKPK